MRSLIKSAMRKAAGFLPPPARGKANLYLHDLSQTWRRRYPARVLHGALRTGGGPAEIAWFGQLRAYRQWRARIFEGAPSIEEGKFLSLRDVLTCREFVAKYDVVLHPANSLTEGRFVRAGWFLVPQYVKCTIDLGRPIEQILSSRDVKNERRVIRKLGYRFEVLRSELALEEFYEEMLLPMEQIRHGELKDVTQLEFLRRKFRNGFLLAAYLDSAWVGANFVVRESPSVLRSAHVGWRNGDEELLRKTRVVSALLAELIQRAQRDGYGTLDLGTSNAFADDGPLLYKLKWGADIVLPAAVDEQGELKDVDALMAVRYNLARAPAQAILHGLPVISKHAGRLRVLGWNSVMRPEFKHQLEKGIEWVNLADSQPTPATITSA